MTMENLTALNEPTYSRVRDRIREEILSGVFKPGERLRTIDLAQRYQVSQMPVREALQHLQGEGLVDLAPNRGASVRLVDERFVSNMYDIRGVIEPLLVRHCVNVATEADVNALTSIEREYEQKVAAGDYDAALALNKEFHSHINRRGDNEDALLIIERHWRLINALRHEYAFGPGRLKQIIEEHTAIIEAIKNHDEEMAVKVAHEHCCHAKDDLLELMRSRKRL